MKKLHVPYRRPAIPVVGVLGKFGGIQQAGVGFRFRHGTSSSEKICADKPPHGPHDPR